MFFGPEDDEDDTDIDDALVDPTHEPGEDYNTSQEELLKYDPEDMESPQFLPACLLARVKGNLVDFLSVLGIQGDEQISKVNQILDQHFPTFIHQSDALFELIENELSNNCLGGVNRVGDLDSTGVFIESKSNQELKLKALQLLYKIRLTRLRMYSKMELGNAG